MKQEWIRSIGHADIFFIEQGAVKFYDSFFPKSEWDDEPKIFRRHYFSETELYLGHYIPQFWQMGSHCSVHFCSEPMPSLLDYPSLQELRNPIG